MARKMKDSGIEWIGEIPEGWECIRNKYLLTSMYSGGTPSASQSDFYTDSDGIPFVSISDMSTTDYVIQTKKHLTSLGVHDKNLMLLPTGTILYSIYATIGAISELKIPATISQAILALNVKNTIDKQFYKYNLVAMRDYVFSSTNGNTQFNLNAAKVWNFSFVYPPYNAQIAIANYLDLQCHNIDTQLIKIRKSIQEYKRLRQAAITQAVTKGVRDEREMKDSGIEWIELYPSDWQIIKVKWLLTERKERSVSGLEEPLSMSQKKGLIPTKDMDSIPNIASSFVGAKLVYKGDLVFNQLKAHLGVFSVSKYDGLVSPDYAVYYSTGLANLNFLELLFKTPQYINEFKKKSSGVGAGLTRLYTGDLYSIYCALPPLAEQKEIADYLDAKCAEIDKLIAKKEQLVKELESYKKSLIYEVVTGKREV